MLGSVGPNQVVKAEKVKFVSVPRQDDGQDGHLGCIRLGLGNPVIFDSNNGFEK
jgi:hypothetical protein